MFHIQRLFLAAGGVFVYPESFASYSIAQPLFSPQVALASVYFTAKRFVTFMLMCSIF